MVVRLFVFALFVAMAPAGNLAQTPDHAAALARAEALWKSQQPQSYEFTLDVKCFCDGLAKTPPTFRVVDGQPVMVRSGIDARLSDPYAAFNTIDKVFEVVRRKLAWGEHKFVVRYDGERGFPVAADIDPSAAVTDDELSISVRDFRVLASAQPTLRFGSTADKLSDPDISAILQVLGETGRTPWILVAHGLRPGFKRWFAQVYFSPQTTHGGVRRGRLAEVSAALQADGVLDDPKTWSVDSTGPYAQVPVAGTNPDRIADPRDLNWPFRVADTMSDEVIRDIVVLIRSSPTVDSAAGAPPRASRYGVASGGWPIQRMGPDRDAPAVISVMLREPDAASTTLLEKRGQSVDVRRQGAAWVVQEIRWWIAD
jgi:hypothetical protein